VSETFCYRIQAPEADREWLIAELYSLGTLGLEEIDTGLLAYFPPNSPSEPVRALQTARPGIVIRGPERIPPADWGQEWRRGLRPRRVGRIWIRPSWCESQGTPELTIDPQQAFGSGEHASTRMALDFLLADLAPGDSLLDFGTGSGILALGALRCGARRALGCDRELVACVEARENATRNGLRLSVFCGTLAALRSDETFDIVVANLLLSELIPWVPRLARHTERTFIVAGALARERSSVLELTRAANLSLRAESRESQGGEVWWSGRFAQGSERQ